MGGVGSRHRRGEVCRSTGLRIERLDKSSRIVVVVVVVILIITFTESFSQDGVTESFSQDGVLFSLCCAWPYNCITIQRYKVCQQQSFKGFICVCGTALMRS